MLQLPVWVDFHDIIYGVYYEYYVEEASALFGCIYIYIHINPCVLEWIGGGT
jgi:hypothetical protein